MRTFIIACIVCLFALSCSVSNEKKAKRLIKLQLEETLHDWSTYEPVKFGTLDSVFTTYEDDSLYFIVNSQYESYMEKTNESLADMKSYAGMYSTYYKVLYSYAEAKTNMFLDSARTYAPMVDSIRIHYIPLFKGWSMTHSFRSNNAMGNKTIGHFQYFFDIDITKITDSKDISESADE